MTNREWFTIRTKVHKENLARGQYARQGYEVYLPQTLKTRRHARRVENVIRPFFTGYLFLHLAPEERNWVTIGSTIGSVGAVHFGDQYPPVPDWMIENLQAREDEQGLISTFEIDTSSLKKGKRIKIHSGELEGLEGIFQEMRGEDRAIVLLEMLRRKIIATVPLTSVDAA